METCVIVGSGPGLGTALAKRFARGGFAVASIGRSRATVDAAVAAVRDIGGTARGYRCDAADETALEATLALVSAEMLQPSVAIYNVGARLATSPADTGAESFVASLRANAGGALAMVRALAPAMRAARRGTLLFSGCGLAVHPSASDAALSIGKAALRSLALTLGEELEPDGLHAATVTVYGAIEAGSRLNPASVAERYWTVHAQERGAWTREEAVR